MARKYKSLQNKIDKEVGHGHAHREHRSKKGRSYKPDKWKILLIKRKLEKEELGKRLGKIV